MRLRSSIQYCCSFASCFAIAESTWCALAFSNPFFTATKWLSLRSCVISSWWRIHQPVPRYTLLVSKPPNKEFPLYVSCLGRVRSRRFVKILVQVLWWWVSSWAIFGKHCWKHGATITYQEGNQGMKGGIRICQNISVFGNIQSTKICSVIFVGPLPSWALGTCL